MRRESTVQAWQRHARLARPLVVIQVVAFAIMLVMTAGVGNADAKGKTKVHAKIHGGTLTVTGSKKADVIALRLRSGQPGTLVVDADNNGSEDFHFDRTRFSLIVVNGRDGADTLLVDESNGVFTTEEATTLNGEKGADTLVGDIGPVTLDGGPGDDTIAGSDAADRIVGGDGPDTIDPNRGDDFVLAGAGDDTVIWDPGDGSDVVEGQAGADTLAFNGSNANEKFEVAPNGGRVRFTRDVANIVMDLDDVETVDLAARGGIDTVTVDDLAGTDLTHVAVDLAAAAGGGDGAADSVTVDGTAGDDAATLVPGAGGSAIVFGGLTVTVTDQEAGDRVTFDGLTGSDTATASGTAGDDSLAVVADGTAARVGLDGGSLVGTVTGQLVVAGLAGDDTISAGIGFATVGVGLVLDGGPGADTIAGSDAADRIVGGDGPDTIDPNRGDDLVLAGAGDDTVIWDPGDGSDVVEGQAGADTLAFNGANANEKFEVAPNGGRVRFTRDVANIVMDLDDVETVDLAARGGIDTVTVDDLAGTDLTHVAVDLAAAAGGGDGAADSVTVDGTAGDDAATLVPGAGGSAIVFGGLTVTVTDQEAGDRVTFDGLTGSDTATASGTAGDDSLAVVADGTAARVGLDGGSLVGTVTGQLVVAGLGGDDTISAGIGFATVGVGLVLDGGPGADTIAGSDAADRIVGGDGPDTIDPNRGDDLVLAGAGDDTVIWDPGDGSDTVEGQAGADTLAFNGSNANEKFEVAPNGGRVRFTRDVANIVMDLDDVETVDLAARGGIDTVTVDDLAGTDLTHVAVDLAAAAGGGDGAADSVTVDGTAGVDSIVVTGAGTSVNVTGLHASVAITDSEGANDSLDIETGDGDDAVDHSGLPPGIINLLIDGAPA